LSLRRALPRRKGKEVIAMSYNVTVSPTVGTQTPKLVAQKALLHRAMESFCRTIQQDFRLFLPPSCPLDDFLRDAATIQDVAHRLDVLESAVHAVRYQADLWADEEAIDLGEVSGVTGQQ